MAAPENAETAILAEATAESHVTQAYPFCLVPNSRVSNKVAQQWIIQGMPSQLLVADFTVFSCPQMWTQLSSFLPGGYWKLFDLKRLCCRCISAVGGLGYLQ